VPGTNTPEIIIEIGKKWGFQFSATPCLQIEEIESELRNCDLIIAVDQYTNDKVVQKYPDLKNLFMLTAGVGFSHLVPTDPVNMDANSIQIELAKCLVTATDLFEANNLILRREQIHVVTPSTVKKFSEARLFANTLAENLKGSVLNLASLSHQMVLNQDINFMLNNVDNCESLLAKLQSNIDILQGETVFKHESLNLSQEILMGIIPEIITLLLSKGPVVILAPWNATEKSQSESSIITQILLTRE